MEGKKKANERTVGHMDGANDGGQGHISTAPEFAGGTLEVEVKQQSVGHEIVDRLRFRTQHQKSGEDQETQN